MRNFDHYPDEVREYLRGGIRHILRIRAERPYLLIAEFDDGVTKRYDMAQELTGVLAPLRDFAEFCRVYVDDTGSVAWDIAGKHIDTSKETLYIYGETVER